MTHTQTKTKKRTERNYYYAKIHAIWSALRTDLKRGSDDYKEALYQFAESELKIERVGSFTELTVPQLRRIVVALEGEQRQPSLIDRANVLTFTPAPQSATAATLTGQPQATVDHFSSLEQRFAIGRLFGYLGWSVSGREAFVRGRFRTEKIERLTTKEAHKLIRVLLNCAGSRYWKNQGKEKVSKPMIATAIPVLKRQLGIG